MSHDWEYAKTNPRDDFEYSECTKCGVKRAVYCSSPEMSGGSRKPGDSFYTLDWRFYDASDTEYIAEPGDEEPSCSMVNMLKALQ